MPDTLYAYVGNLEKSYDDAGVLHVRGLATDATLDLDQQRCDPEWLKSAMPKWYEWGNIREMHGANAVGTATDMEQKGAGWIIEAAIVDPAAARKVEKGVLKGFSIGIKGHGLDTSEKALALAPRGIINKGDICEISLVDRPANPNAKLELAKMVDGELVKSDLSVASEVEGDNCPPCDQCNGAGWVTGDENAQVKCPKCGGSGEGDVTTYPNVDGGDKEEGHASEKAADGECETCDGKGTILEGNRKCPDCDGTGKMSKAAEPTDYFGWTAADRAEWSPWQKQLMPDSYKKDYSDKERASMANSGQAMPGGGYPIKTVQDLKNAIQAFGRAKNPAATKAHIKSRAKALGREDLIPDNWKSAWAGLAAALNAVVVTKAADGDTFQHDPATIAAIRDGLIDCATAELMEMKDGEDETWDVSVLVGCLSDVLSWWQHESNEGETSPPFGGDDMSLTGLGVSPDLIKAASAETATDDDKIALKTAVRDALGLEDTPSIPPAVAEALEKAASLEERLAKVEEMAAPKGIALRATQVQQSRASEAEVLENEAERFKALGMTHSDPETRAEYLKLSTQKSTQAAAIRKAYGLEGETK